MSQVVRWRPQSGVGLEQLDLGPTETGHSARSVVIGDADGMSFACTYLVRLDPSWRFLSLDLQHIDGRRLVLELNGSGWHDADGPLPELIGCVDIDLSASPFTNSLPIRRAGLAVGEQRRFDMAFVEVGSLKVYRDGQIYTRLDDAGRYRFQAADGSFEAELTVDEEGLVVDYPPLFQRL